MSFFTTVNSVHAIKEKSDVVFIYVTGIMPRKLDFRYLKSLNNGDEALFSAANREVKTKQFVVFAAMSVLALIFGHNNVLFGVPFFVIGLVYFTYKDDILPISYYLAAYQEYRKFAVKRSKEKRQEGVKISDITDSIRRVVLSPEFEVSLAGSGAAAAGFYGIYLGISTLNLVALIIGAVLVALGIVLVLSAATPFLSKLMK